MNRLNGDGVAVDPSSSGNSPTPPPAPVPEAVPVVDRTQVVTAISVPPLAVVIGALISSRMSWTQNNPTPLLVTLMIGGGAILAMAVVFHLAVARRYRGASLVFLNLAFLFGQGIVCLFLWFGACVIIAS